jgi:sulfur-carrier protein
MKVLYFAWLRERVGMAEESVEIPVGVETVGQVIAWLTARGENYAHAFEKPTVIRAALDKRHAKLDMKIAGAKEIAFFPPMTGG